MNTFLEKYRLFLSAISAVFAALLFFLPKGVSAAITMGTGGVISVADADVAAAGASILSMMGTYLNLFVKFLPYIVTFVAVWYVISIFRQGSGVKR